MSYNPGTVRDYAVLHLGRYRSSAGATALGGNALLTTGTHRLDGPEHTTAGDSTTLDATVDEHGLLPKLSGDATEVFDGSGAWRAEAGGTILAHTYDLANEGSDSLVHAHGAAGATETIDPTLGNVHTLTLDVNCTLTLDAPAGASATLELWITQDVTGGWVITWPGSVTVVGTLDTTASTTSIVVLATVDTGTSWVAAVLGSGSGGTPATTVESEAAFDISPAVGTDTEYARQDHTHGSPSTATLQGAGHFEILMASGPADPLLTSDGLDYLYVWVT